VNSNYAGSSSWLPLRLRSGRVHSSSPGRAYLYPQLKSQSVRLPSKDIVTCQITFPVDKGCHQI